jgi:hypothetical protein
MQDEIEAAEDSKPRKLLERRLVKTGESGFRGGHAV